MDRRVFLGTLTGGLLVAPLAAEAQARKVPRVGFLYRGSPAPSQEIDAFQRGLRELGYIEGQNIAVEYRFARGQVERLPELAAELVRLNPDVIVAPYTPPALAAKQATSTIPIVFAVVADAVGAGRIVNLARPGGNITGLTSSGADLGGKRLELVKQVIPKVSRVGRPLQPCRSVQRARLRAATTVGAEPASHSPTACGYANRAEFEAAFSAMTRERPNAMVVAPGALTDRAQGATREPRREAPDAVDVGPSTLRGCWRPDVVRCELFRS